jgi:hypothetical protein
MAAFAELTPCFGLTTSVPRKTDQIAVGLAKILQPGVLDDADHLDILRPSGNTERLSNWAAILEETVCESSIHDHDLRRGDSVSCLEVSPDEYWNANRSEILRRNGEDEDRRRLVRLWNVPGHFSRRPAGTSADRQRRDRARAGDLRRAVQSLEHVAKHSARAWRRVLLQTRDIGVNHAAPIESTGLGVELRQRPGEQARTGHEKERHSHLHDDHGTGEPAAAASD